MGVQQDPRWIGTVYPFFIKYHTMYLNLPNTQEYFIFFPKCLLGMAGGMSQTISDTVDSKRGQEL